MSITVPSTSRRLDFETQYLNSALVVIFEMIDNRTGTNAVWDLTGMAITMTLLETTTQGTTTLTVTSTEGGATSGDATVSWNDGTHLTSDPSTITVTFSQATISTAGAGRYAYEVIITESGSTPFQMYHGYIPLEDWTS
jgi:hypothetical protein